MTTPQDRAALAAEAREQVEMFGRLQRMWARGDTNDTTELQCCRMSIHAALDALAAPAQPSAQPVPTWDEDIWAEAAQPVPATPPAPVASMRAALAAIHCRVLHGGPIDEHTGRVIAETCEREIPELASLRPAHPPAEVAE